MQNENVNENQEVVKPTNENNQYIEALKKVNQDYVRREEYEKLMEENKSLIDGVLNGRKPEEETETPEPVDLGKLRNELFNGELSNIDYVKKTLQLRKEVIARGGTDPFLPVGEQISPTDYDIEKAKQVAEVLQECVDYADGDSEIFTNELMRRTVDIKIR